MSEMVERGARALCERAGVSPDDIGGGTWDGGSYPKGTPAWRSWCDDARAVLAAIREPTEAMINNPMARCYNYGEFADKEVRRIYSAMIDEALK